MRRTIRTLTVASFVGLLLWAMAFATGCTAEAPEAEEPAAVEPPESAEDDAVEVEGLEVVEGACAQCHDATRIYLLQTEMPDWNAVIAQMESAHGAVLTEQEKTAVAAYLESRTATDAEEIISGKCTTCHDMSRIYLLQTEMPDWEAIVARMTQEHGAALSVEEQAAVVEYLENQ